MYLTHMNPGKAAPAFNLSRISIRKTSPAAPQPRTRFHESARRIDPAHISEPTETKTPFALRPAKPQPRTQFHANARVVDKADIKPDCKTKQSSALPSPKPAKRSNFFFWAWSNLRIYFVGMKQHIHLRPSSPSGAEGPTLLLQAGQLEGRHAQPWKIKRLLHWSRSAQDRAAPGQNCPELSACLSEPKIAVETPAGQNPVKIMSLPATGLKKCKISEWLKSQKRCSSVTFATSSPLTHDVCVPEIQRDFRPLSTCQSDDQGFLNWDFGEMVNLDDSLTPLEKFNALWPHDTDPGYKTLRKFKSREEILPDLRPGFL